ncbi:MAG: GC-type dockerin domain-anchored protein, partial [Planctomycetota bacterium]
LSGTEWLVRNFVLGGMTWAEAAWSSIPAVSWMQIVLGDPLAMARLEVEVVCSPADLARRFGVLDELDVREALERFTAGDATADFDASGAIDIFDLILFFELFDAGCG